MKQIIIALLLISSTVFASEQKCSEETGEEQTTERMEIKTDVPTYLKGATITVRLADGTESTVPAEKFKVVARAQQFIVTKTEKLKTISCSSTSYNKNRVSLLGGHGAKSGLNASRSGTTVTVESKVGLVGGAQYQRMLTEIFSVGVQLQTSKTGSVMVGVDF